VIRRLGVTYQSLSQQHSIFEFSSLGLKG